MQNQHDVIIIGAGLGGLTAGAKLAKEGYKVLIIEQHDIPGGCATTFRRKGYTVEVGLHELDGLDDKDIKRTIFDEFEVFDHVQFVKLPEFYKFQHRDESFIMPHDREEAIKRLNERFPDEKKAILKYFKIIYGFKNEILKYPKNKILKFLLMPLFPLLYPTLTKYSKKSIGDILDTLTNNEDLKLVLTANVAYYHDDPHTLSSVYFSSGQASYFEGGHYIRGGSQKLSDYLASYIREHGGEIIYKHIATRITTENGRATGVEYKKNRGKETPALTAKGKFIIANAAIPNVIEMLDDGPRRLIEERAAGMKTACSILTLYLGLNQPPSEFGCRHYSTFVIADHIQSLQDQAKDLQGHDFKKKSFAFVDYSQIDSGLAPEGKYLMAVATTDYLEHWEGLSRTAYREKKKEITDILIRRLENILPGISEAIEYKEMATPKTIVRYTMNPQGSVYGYAQTVEQSGRNRIRAKSPVDGLYFASAWAFPGGGFTGAIISGYLCALKIQKDNRQQKV